MRRLREHIACDTSLNQLSEIHHGEAVRKIRERIDVMGDDEKGQVELAAQVLEQVQDGSRSRNI